MLEKIEYRNNELYFDNININELAKKVKTPIYIYSQDRIVENFKEYENNFKKYGIENHLLCYAVKANENMTILKLLIGMGAGADAVSANEIRKAVLAGVTYDKVVYSGVGKSDEELLYAVENEIGQINIESKEEFYNIRSIAKSLNKVANISVRLNPDIDPETHEKITTGKEENKFGVDIKVVKEIIEEAKNDENLNFKGLSVHIGSQILNINNFEKTFKVLSKIYEKNPQFTTIDFGGGVGIQYRENEKAVSREEFVKLIKKYFSNFKGKIMMEPGRSIVGDAGIFLTKIMYMKKTEVRNFIIIDGGMNNLIRPALYDAYHHPLETEIQSQEFEEYDIVGPICESSDVFVKNIKLNKTNKNNYIVFLSSGAYGRSMAGSYTLHDIAGELLIKNGKVERIRKEITFEDLLQFENV